MVTEIEEEVKERINAENKAFKLANKKFQCKLLS
jgi:hypothetical protein